MESHQPSLGGRIALLKRAELTPNQRKLYDQLQHKTVPWATESGFRATTDAGELIGPFNALLRSPDVAAAQLNVESTERMNTDLPEKTRQVVILTVGAAWQAAYELYAHVAAARKAGLAEADIQALVHSQTPTGLSDEERLAHTVTQQIVGAHQLGDELYQDAISTFGEKGLVDLLILVGQYMTVSAILNTFAVPAPTDQ